MLISLAILLATLFSIFRLRSALQLENLALRHQIGVLRRSARKHPKLTSGDRLLWICLSWRWRDWRSALAIVKPETVIAWHRAGFRLFWTQKVRRGQPGRPVISREIRDLIRKMCRENPTWSAPCIHGELLKLGIDIGESSVSKNMVRCRKPPSQTWRTFLENHTKQLVSIGFFTVPTIRFQVLYVFLVLAHDRRRILHFNVTAHPTAEWTGQQLREAFPFDQLPRYLLRDRDAIFGDAFREQVRDMGICEVLSAPRSPWQRAYVERVNGSFVVHNKRSNQPFHERMGQGNIGDGLDFRHLQYPQIGLPLVEPIKRIVVGADVLRHPELPSNGAVEHPTECDTIDLSRMDAKTNDPARVLIHDHQDPVGPQRGRLAPEQIHAPEAVFHVAQESQPRGTTGVLSRSVVMGENPSNHVFVDLDVERQGDLLCDSRTTPVGLRCFISTTA